MMISGYVMNFDKFSMQKRFKILIPFFIFGILYTLLSDFGILNFMESLDKHGYWFLWAIVIFSMFLYMIRRSKINLIIGMFIIELILVLLRFFYHGTLIDTFLSLNILCYLWPFFSLGVIMNRGLSPWINQRALVSFIINSIFIIITILCVIKTNQYSKWIELLMAFPICINFLIAFSYVEKKFKNKCCTVKKILKHIGTDIGTNTLQIYVLHYFVIYLLNWHYFSHCVFDLHSFGRYMIANNMAWLELIVSPVLAILISYICIYTAKFLYKMHLGIVFGR
jgi:hypothetical protein